LTFVLGVNAFHADASAVLLHDGKVIAAAEEERFQRVKHLSGFPSEAITWCLLDAGITIEDVNHIAINSLPGAHLGRKLIYTLLNRPDFSFLLDRLKNKKERADLGKNILDVFPGHELRAKLHFVEHHRSHLASAFFASPFENAAVVSVDGFGDFASSAWGFGKGSDLTVEDHIFFPHSLGVFYTAISQFLGFPNYGDEYKVMGLAPYGKPNFLSEMRQIVRLRREGRFDLALDYFTHASQRVPHQWSNGAPVVGTLFSSHISDLLGKPRLSHEPLTQKHMDIACSVQAMYEEAFFHLLNSLYLRSPIDCLCIAGGCGANSVANGKVSALTPFRQIYVQAAAGDAGGALGAALDVWHQLGNSRCEPMGPAYLGPCPRRSEVAALLQDPQVVIDLSGSACSVIECGDPRLPDELALLEFVTTALTEGKVVGWFEGRMEWGPRALGHRSIIGDPRRSDMKDILNLKIKRRESFRPFAPSVLKEETSDWFELTSPLDADVPYMMQVYPIRLEKRPLIPAVTHVDGTGRLQTVTEADNGRYYRLIRCFYERTGVPMVLNTSFNENEPIVATPRHALDCFLRTKMDVLVIDNFLIHRES